MKRQLSVLATVLFALPIASTAQTAEKTDTVSTKMMNLDEVTVRAMLVKHGKQSDEYRMIPKLTQGTTSVYDVLSRLPGIAYNDLTNTLSVRMDRNVLIEVDGKRVSQEYLQALTPERISRVEVVYAPSARYTTEGFHYVINVKLKNDYVGHDISLGNYTMISAGDNNGSDIIANEQPKA